MNFVTREAVPTAACDEVASGSHVSRPPAAGDTYFRTLLCLSQMEAEQHRLLRVFLEHGRTMCGAKNAGALRLALAGIRTSARDMMRKAAELEQLHWPTVDAQFDADLADIESGDFDKATLVYGRDQ